MMTSGPQNFRMRKPTFMELHEELAPILQWENTRIWRPIPVQEQMAIALWKLATSDSYQPVPNHCEGCGGAGL